MKIFRLAAPVLVFALASAGASAADAAGGTRIAFFNPNRAVLESPQGKAASDKFESERKTKARELEPMQKELRAMEEKVNRDGPLMTEEQRAAEEAKYRTLSQRLARRTSEINEDLNQRRQELFGGVEQLVLSTARQVATERKYDLVLGPGVFFASKDIDMTDEVIRRMSTAGAAPAAAPKPTTPPATPTATKPAAPAPKK